MSAQLGTVVVERPRGWGDVSGLEVPDWRSGYGLVAGISDRARDFKLPAQGRAVQLEGLLGALGKDFVQLVVSRQVHGARVHCEGSDRTGIRQLEGADGHVTTQAGVLLAVTVADCVPVYLAQPAAGAVALLHAGWRGVSAGILEAGVSVLSDVCGGAARDIVMHCGVAICGDCYEVGPEVAEALGVKATHGRARLDLRAVLVDRAARDRKSVV